MWLHTVYNVLGHITLYITFQDEGTLTCKWGVFIFKTTQCNVKKKNINMNHCHMQIFAVNFRTTMQERETKGFAPRN